MANRVNELTGNTEGIAYAERRNWDAKTKLLSCIDKKHMIFLDTNQLSLMMDS